MFFGIPVKYYVSANSEAVFNLEFPSWLVLDTKITCFLFSFSLGFELKLNF